MDGIRKRQVAPGSPGVPFSAIAVVLAGALAVFGFGSFLVAANQATPTAQTGECITGTPVASPGAVAATPEASPGASPAAEFCVEIGSYDIYFAPNLITIPANTPVQVTLPNFGASLHNFSVDEHNNPNVPNLGISVDIQPGTTETVTIEAPAGTYYFYCNVPGHEPAGMYGYLVVEEGAQVSAESATVTPPAGA